MSKLTPGKEFERKFLVVVPRLPESLLRHPKRIRQGYLSLAPAQVRVRVTGDGEAFMEVKGPDDDEFGPYLMELGHAERLLKGYASKVASIIEKDRHDIRSGWDGLKWEVDFFKGDNAPLVVAEIETPTKHYRLDPELFPDWLGPEVTGDPAFKNKNLAVHPFSAWPKARRTKVLKAMGRK